MLRSESQGFAVVWEAAPAPTLPCPSKGLVTADGCQECYVWQADRNPSWCRIGAQRRSEAAESFGPIPEELDQAQLAPRSGTRGERRSLANEYTYPERELFEACQRVMLRVETQVSASEIVRRALLGLGRMSDGAITKTFAFAAARSVGMEHLLLPLGVSGMRSAGVDAIRAATARLMEERRDITTNRLITEVAESLGSERTVALAAAVKRARLDVINARIGRQMEATRANQT